MNDEDKTKKQLIEELNHMRQKLAAYEHTPQSKEPSESVDWVQRRKRSDLDADIEFIGDFDLLTAHGVNISDGGLCLQLSEDLPFEMQFYHKGEKKRKRAYLVWLKRHTSGGYHFGFKFIESETHPTF